MTLNQSALLELTQMLRTADGGDVMRQMLGFMLQALVDAEATSVIGAGPHERSQDRVTHRNGTRPKTVSTTAGDLTVRIPKLRAGSFFPTLLEPRRRVDVALHAVIMEAYVHGVSTRKVDDLVVALGVDTGISKSEVSRICAGLDEQVAAYDTRPLDHCAFPYVFLDATYCKARLNGRVVSQAVVIATGVSSDGRREVLGSRVGDSENKTFRTEFLRSLRERGLDGVQLVISDHHRGLMAAVDQVMAGSTWQRCRVHFMRNVLTRVPKASSAMPISGSRPRSAQSSPNPPAHWCVSRSRSSRPCSNPSSPRSPRCCARPGRRSPRSPTSPKRTGPRSGRPTRSSASTARSNGAPRSSGSSRTPPRCIGSPRACSSRPTTSGK